MEPMLQPECCYPVKTFAYQFSDGKDLLQFDLLQVLFYYESSCPLFGQEESLRPLLLGLCLVDTVLPSHAIHHTHRRMVDESDTDQCSLIASASGNFQRRLVCLNSHCSESKVLA